MDYRWLTVIGLILDITGAIILAFGIIVTKDKAVKLGVTWLADRDNPAENYKIPSVEDRIIQAKNAKLGICLLSMGFIFQLIGSWPR